MIKGSLIFWLALGLGAFTIDWGLFWLLSFALFLLALISGMLFAIYSTTLLRVRTQNTENVSFRPGSVTVMSKLADLKKEDDPSLKFDEFITGLPEIDHQLNVVLEFIVRDYVVPWSSILSCTGNNHILDESFKLKLRSAIGNFASPFRSIDWVDYFTAQLVDDFVTHLHLYRVALERVHHRRPRKQGVSDDDLIEAAFFEAEAELGDPHISREAVSRNDNAETSYFEGISDVLLSQLISPAELESTPFRLLSRHVLVWAVFRPLLAAVSNPDFFNRSVIWLCRASPLPADHFSVITRTSTNAEELTAVLERVSFELSRCHALDALTESHELREQLAALYHLQQLCDRRLLELQMPRSRSTAISGSESTDFAPDSTVGTDHGHKSMPATSISVIGLSSMTNDDNEPSYQTSPYSSLSVAAPQDNLLITMEPNLLTLNDIINNPSLLDQFTAHVKKQKMYHYLAFFLNAQAFATSFSEAIHRLSAPAPSYEQDLDDTKSVSMSLGADNVSVFSLPDSRSLPGGLLMLTKSTSKSLAHMVSNNAGTIFENYLSPRADSSQRLRLDDGIVSRTYNKIDKTITFLQRIENESVEILQTIPTDLFSEATLAVMSKLESRAMPGFRIELEQQIRAERASPNRQVFGSASSMQSNQSTGSNAKSDSMSPKAQLSINNNQISARIIDANKIITNNETYVVYIIHVSSIIYRPTRVDSQDALNGKIDGLSWNTTRRYRDFAELHAIVKDRFPSISGRLHFPKKLLFNNLSDEVITKRMRELGDFMFELLHETTVEGCLDRESASSLKMMLLLFLQPGPWDRCGDTPQAPAPITARAPSTEEAGAGGRRSSAQMSRQSESDLKASGSTNRLPGGIGQVFKAIKTLPDRVDRTVDKLFSFMDIPEDHGQSNQPQNNAVDAQPRLTSDRTSVYKSVLDEVGLQRNDSGFHGGMGSTAPGASASIDPSLNIPLRILLRLGHEVFDLGSPKHDWLRTQFVDILSRVVASTHGTSMNKKILGQVEWLTSREQVVSYIRAFRDMMWPNGKSAASSLAISDETPKPPPTSRHPHTLLCARLICKTRMMGVVPDEIRTVLSAEASREAIVQLFELFQHPTLNKRLSIVIFEGLLRRLYPQINFDEVFRRLHAGANIHSKTSLQSKDYSS